MGRTLTLPCSLLARVRISCRACCRISPEEARKKPGGTTVRPRTDTRVTFPYFTAGKPIAARQLVHDAGELAGIARRATVCVCSAWLCVLVLLERGGLSL